MKSSFPGIFLLCCFFFVCFQKIVSIVPLILCISKCQDQNENEIQYNKSDGEASTLDEAKGDLVHQSDPPYKLQKT